MNRDFFLRFERLLPVLRKTVRRKRFLHSLGAMHLATVLADRYGEEPLRAAAAGLLHDCGRLPRVEEVVAEVRRRKVALAPDEHPFPKIWHAELSARIAAEDWGVSDEGILRAIRVHPTADAGMTRFDKIVFLADYIEPTRRFEGLSELRALAESDLDAAFRRALWMKTQYVRDRDRPLHPRSLRALAEAGGPTEEVASSSPPEKRHGESPGSKRM